MTLAEQLEDLTHVALERKREILKMEIPLEGEERIPMARIINTASTDIIGAQLKTDETKMRKIENEGLEAFFKNLRAYRLAEEQKLTASVESTEGLA